MSGPISYPKFAAVDLSGNPLALGKVYSYEPGTLIEKDAFSDSGYTVPHTNPIALDERGECILYVSGATDLFLFDEDGNEIWGPVRVGDVGSIGLVNIAADTTITTALDLQEGDVYSIDTGVTLTINGPFSANLSQHFDCTGTGKVDFSGNKSIKSVSPHWWGATFDGTTLDTAALQAALNSGAKVVEFPGNLTAKTRRLTIPAAGIEIWGNNSTLDWDITDDAYDGVLKSAVAIANLTIRNLRIKPRHSQSLTPGNWRHAILVAAGGATDVLLDGCYFEDAFMGFYTQDSQAWVYPNAFYPTTRVTIRNCKMVNPTMMADGHQKVAGDYNTYGYFMANLGYKATECLIEGNYCENNEGLVIFNGLTNGTPSVGWSDHANNTVVNNTTKNCFGDGIYIHGKNNVIIGNVLYRQGASALVANNYTHPNTGLEDTHDNVFSNNIVQSAGRCDANHAICAVVYGKNTKLLGNTIILENPATFPNNSMTAFGVTGAGTVVSGNNVSCKDGTVAGDHLSFISLGSSDVSVIGNSVQDVYKIVELGSLTTNLDRITFSNNHFRNFVSGFIVAHGSASILAKNWTLNNNILQNYSAYGIIISQSVAYPIPIYWTLNGNQFIGGNAAAIGIQATNSARLTLNGNAFSGSRARDISYNEAGGNGPIFGEGNVSDGLATGGGSFNAAGHAFRWANTGPTVGTWRVDEIAWVYTAASGAYIGNLCTVAGTLGTLNSGGTTGAITTGTTALTVNSATGLYPGCYITIAGVTGVKKVMAVSGTTITIDVAADATVGPAAAVAYSAPTFKTWGLIS